jgi:hypothetical protein
MSGLSYQMKPGGAAQRAAPVQRRVGAALVDNRQAPARVGAAARFPAVAQRILNGTAAEPGVNLALPGTAGSLGEAARKSAEAINLRARTTAGGAVERSSGVGVNNGGNLHIQSDFDEGAGLATLETWIELTGVGGGYVKRVRVTRPGMPVMDRVMNEPVAEATQLQRALAADLNAAGLAGDEQYGSVHTVHGEDADGLGIIGNSERTADNLTKMVGEGARFPWLARRLAAGEIGNTTRGVLKMTVTIPQEGRFDVDPTFQQLWGAWNAAFDRAYMQNVASAKIILSQRLRAGWRTPRDREAAGGASVASGTSRLGEVSSLLRRSGAVALMPADPSGPAIVGRFGMRWTSDH